MARESGGVVVRVSLSAFRSANMESLDNVICLCTSESGDWANRVTHPHIMSNMVDRRYVIRLFSDIDTKNAFFVYICKVTKLVKF